MNTTARNQIDGSMGFHFLTREGRFLNQSDKVRKKLTAGCRISCVEGGGSKNSPLGVERHSNDGFYMGSGGKGRRKEKQNIRG
jgi:hypothetical protein